MVMTNHHTHCYHRYCNKLCIPHNKALSYTRIRALSRPESVIYEVPMMRMPGCVDAADVNDLALIGREEHEAKEKATLFGN